MIAMPADILVGESLTAYRVRVHLSGARPYEPFEGDGRRKVPGMEFTYAQARDCIRRFVESGRSTHSQMGMMLPAVTQWCIYRHKTFIVSTHYINGNVAGYMVELQ